MEGFVNYNYSVSNDTLNGSISIDSLSQDISNASLSPALDMISVNGDAIVISFMASLSASEETSLTAVVNNHDGEPIPEEEKAQLVEFVSKDMLGIPKVVVSKPSGDFSTMVTHNFCDNTTWANGVNDSSWELKPDPGKILLIDRAEAQFEHDLSFAASKVFIDYYLWHPAFPGTSIPVQTVTFDSVRSMFELGNAHFHSPALPEIPNGLTTIIFDYASKLEFCGDEKPLMLHKLVVRLENDTEATGTYATIGFVTTTVDAT